jgi:Arylsulfotransferase (ASST)
MNARIRLAAAAALATAGLAGPDAPASGAAMTISPLSGTPTALAQTQISFLGAPAGALGSLSVVGSRSGSHHGRLRSYSSASGASFLPSTPFTPGERVTVRATLTTASGTRRTLSDTFTIATPARVALAEPAPAQGAPGGVQSFQSRPDLRPPTIGVHPPAGGAPAYVFVAPTDGAGQHGPMILDDMGGLVWFRPLAGPEIAANLRTQVLHDKNVLTWWQGRAGTLGYGFGVDVVANANYRTVAVVHAGNGLQADGHEFTLTPRGSAFVLSYNAVTPNNAPTGVPASGPALDCVIQQVDVHTGLVMAEWHSLGRVAAPQPCPSRPVPEAPLAQRREPWSAQPSEPPAITARSRAGATAVYASWNGATTVKSWQLLVGTGPGQMSAVSTTPKSGFETTIPSPNPPDGHCPAGVPCAAPAPWYVEVRALSASGKALATSKAIQPAVE